MNSGIAAPLALAVVWLASLATPGAAQDDPAPYPGWTHSGSLYLLTTPEGANLPASASEEGFPLLVRLRRDLFDFSQAKPGGEDIRFSSGGKPLAYQVEEWDVARGTACLWVRLPTIKGDARQEIRMHWGRAAAASESSGSAVVHESIHVHVAKARQPDGQLHPQHTGVRPQSPPRRPALVPVWEA